jgi:hypothetical protein
MNKLALFLLFTLCTSSASFAQEVVEIWRCQAGNYDSGSKVLVKATIMEGRDAGDILVAGVVYKAVYSVSGFERRWDFDFSTKNTYNYSFVIWPEGKALYYDFSSATVGDTVKPSMSMFCKQD